MVVDMLFLFLSLRFSLSLSRPLPLPLPHPLTSLPLSRHFPCFVLSSASASAFCLCLWVRYFDYATDWNDVLTLTPPVVVNF